MKQFIGTFFFLFFALSGTQVANTTKHADPLLQQQYISLVFGLSLAVNAWVWFRVSGGLFNPAVSTEHRYRWKQTGLISSRSLLGCGWLEQYLSSEVS